MAEGPLLGLLLGESVVAVLFASQQKQLTVLASSMSRFLNHGVGVQITRTTSVVLTILFASSLVRMVSLQKRMLGSHEGFDNSVSQTMAVERLYSTRQVAFLSGSDLLLLWLLRAMQQSVAEVRRLQASQEALKRQASGLSTAYQKLQQEQDGNGKVVVSETKGKKEEGDEAPTIKILKEENAALHERNEKLLADNRSSSAALAAMKKQAENQSKEYNRLMDSHIALKDQMEELDQYELVREGGKKDA